MEQIIKKEDGLDYMGGFLRKRGSLVLTQTSLYFLKGKSTKVFDIPLKDISSVNCKKGIGTGVDHLYVIYQENGKEKQAKIQHFGFFSAVTIGNLSRLSLYFAQWEQMINDARFGKHSSAPSNLDDLEKLSELRQKGVLTEEEFTAKKKQLLGI